MLLAGGRFKHGQRIAFEPNTVPLSKHFVSVLNHLGIDDHTLGNSTSSNKKDLKSDKLLLIQNEQEFTIVAFRAAKGDHLAVVFFDGLLTCKSGVLSLYTRQLRDESFLQTQCQSFLYFL